MIISEAMQRILSEIRRIELCSEFHTIEGSETQLGGRLIHLYQDTDDPRVSALIVRFMKLAGPVWQKKLIAAEAASPGRPVHFNSLDEYLALIRRENLHTL